MGRDEWSPNTKCLQDPAYKSSAQKIFPLISIKFHDIP